MIRIALMLILLPLCSMAQQKVNLTFSGGFANYSGDLTQRRFTVEQAGGTFGAGISYELLPKFLLRGGLQYARIGADDKKATDPLLIARNLNFKTSIGEAHLLFDYSFFDLQFKQFTPYVFAGLAIFHFNPYTYDTLGRKYYLHDLGTEGQGLPAYPDRKPYALTQLAVPFGAGIRFRINDNTTLGYEVGVRKTFTDYLDDVSNRYADPASLLAAHGPKDVELSYRGNELKGGSPDYPANGTRGGPNYKDWYYFQTLTVSVGLSDGHRRFLGGPSRRGSVSCPAPVL